MPTDRRVGSDEPASYNAATSPDAGRATSFASPARGTLLLAVDRSARSEPPAQAALDLATRHGARVQVMTVYDTRPQLIPPPLDLALALEDRVGGAALHEQEEREVRELIQAGLGRPVDWPVDLRLGTPSPTIIDAARATGASMIVLGLRRHSMIDRAFRDETALNVMRAAPCSVLAVTPWTTIPPKRVLVGIDFGRASLHAARVALDLVADGGTMILAYATPPELPAAPDDGEHLVHTLGVDAAWRRFITQLAAPANVTVEHVVLEHQPGRSVSDLLSQFADISAIDLVALGSRRHGRLERWLLGSVTSEMARDGAYALLAVPPDDATP